jgi:hypothetical protein
MWWGEGRIIIINMLLSVRFLLKIQPVYMLKASAYIISEVRSEVLTAV